VRHHLRRLILPVRPDLLQATQDGERRLMAVRWDPRRAGGLGAKSWAGDTAIREDDCHRGYRIARISSRRAGGLERPCQLQQTSTDITGGRGARACRRRISSRSNGAAPPIRWRNGWRGSTAAGSTIFSQGRRDAPQLQGREEAQPPAPEGECSSRGAPKFSVRGLLFGSGHQTSMPRAGARTNKKRTRTPIGRVPIQGGEVPE
jgi:hypothetical protein